MQTFFPAVIERDETAGGFGVEVIGTGEPGPEDMGRGRIPLLQITLPAHAAA